METRVNETFSTNNLGQFKRLLGNRVLNMVHVKRLEESIKKNGMLEIDIIVNEKMEVIDGQNRLKAAENVGSHVFYKVCKGYGLEQAQTLNENVKKWRKVDYLESYCELGYSPYLKFREFMRTYPDLQFNACESILTLRTSSKQTTILGKSAVSKYFETGLLEIPDIKKSYKIADMVMSIKPHFDGFSTSTFVRAMLQIFQNKEYDHQEFIKKLENKLAPSLDLCANMEQYKLLVEEIYNYRRSLKVNLRY